MCKDMFFLRKLKDELKKSGDEVDEMSALYSIFKEMFQEKVPAQTVLFQEHDPSNNKAYIVLDGEVGIFKHNETKVFEEDYKRLQEKVKGTKNGAEVEGFYLELIFLDDVKEKPQDKQAKKLAQLEEKKEKKKSLLINTAKTMMMLSGIKHSKFHRRNTIKDPALIQKTLSYVKLILIT